MTRRRTIRTLATTLAVGAAMATMAACSSDPPVTAGAVGGAASVGSTNDESTVYASCAARQVFWHGTWWGSDPPPEPGPLLGQAENIKIPGTMTPAGPGRAVFASEQINQPQPMVDTGIRDQNRPPYPCSIQSGIAGNDH